VTERGKLDSLEGEAKPVPETSLKTTIYCREGLISTEKMLRREEKKF